jgi:hypothetical protein
MCNDHSWIIRGGDDRYLICVCVPVMVGLGLGGKIFSPALTQSCRQAATRPQV